MDWRRAKNVLIYIFIVLNIFLFVYLMFFGRHGGEAENNIVTAVEILQDRGVELKCKIPDTEDSHRIRFESLTLDKESIASKLLDSGENNSYTITQGGEFNNGTKKLTFDDSSSFTYKNSDPKGEVDISDRGNTVKYCLRFLEDINLPVSEIYVDTYEKNYDGTVTIAFKEKHKKYIVFNNDITITINKNGITQLKCSLIKIIGFDDTKIKKIVPAYQILLRNYIQHSRTTTITDIDIGFNFTGFTKGKRGTSTSIIPIWRVREQNGTDKFFSAIDGIPIENTN